MNGSGAFSQFCINYAPSIVSALIGIAVCLVLGARYLAKSNDSRYRYEMRFRSASNGLCFIIAVLYLYEGMRIGNVRTMLFYMNAPYYEGGQGASPVATESELKSLSVFGERAKNVALVMFALCIVGCALQYRLLKRHRAGESQIASLTVDP